MKECNGLGLFEFFSLGDTFALVFGAPHLRLGVGLGQLTLEVDLGFRLFLELFADTVDVVLQVAELAEQGGALAALLIGHALGVLQLGRQRHLQFVELSHLRLGIFQLAQVVAVFDAQLLLGGIEVVEGAVGLVQLALHFVQLLLQLLRQFLAGSLTDANVKELVQLLAWPLPRRLVNVKLQLSRVNNQELSSRLQIKFKFFVFLKQQQKKKSQ